MPQEAAAPSLRGLVRSGAEAAWASGSEGTILHTIDAGAHWAPIPPPADAAQADFRDLAFLPPSTLLLMAAGQGAGSGLWRSEDGGRQWSKALDCPWPEGFFDGMAFWDGRRGLLVGDPVDGALMILRTEDGGRSWRHLRDAARAHAVPGEFAFAASGTSVCTWGEQHAWIGTGGAGAARVWRSADGGASWEVADTPLFQGRESAGVFSICFTDADHGVIVGGDYLRPEERARSAAWTADGGRSWTLAATPPGGYRSCVGAGEGALYCTGPNGTDVSRDGGRSWQPARDAGGAPLAGHHVLAWPHLAGARGRITTARRP